MMRRTQLRARPLLWIGLGLCVGVQTALAQNATSPILAQYANARGAWFDAIWPFANGLFALLATIEFAWSMAILALERADLQTFLAGFVRKIMWIGAFFTLLTFGPTWIPAIIDSFIDLGAAAGNGGAPLTPSLVFQRGIEIAGRLMDGAGAAMFITNFGASLALVASALLVMLAFVMVTIQFVVAMVESYIVVAAGLIFLGFGGSRWTVPYVERYVALAVAVGVKIMVLYLLVGLGMAVSEGWIESAIAVPEQPSPGMSALEIVGSALIFGMLCWQAPKLVSGLLGGAPSLGAGDALSSAAGPAALVAGGAGVIATGVGIGFGISARSKWNDAKQACPASTCQNPGQLQLGKDAGTAADISTVFIIVGAVGIVAGATLFFTAPNDEKRAAQERRVVVSPWVASGAGGIGVGGAL